MSILAMLTAVTGWVAFGSGPRKFLVTLPLPFLSATFIESVGSRFGRVVFAGTTLLMVLMLVWSGVSGVARLRRAAKVHARGTD